MRARPSDGCADARNASPCWGAWWIWCGPEEVLHHVTKAVRDAQPFVVANHNLHSLYLLRGEPGFPRFYDEADLIEADSAPLIAFRPAAAAAGRPFHRCTYLDWRDALLEPGRPAWLARLLPRRRAGRGGERGPQAGREYPASSIARARRLFRRRRRVARTPGARRDRRPSSPHILFVGMGMPRQEVWIEQQHRRACRAASSSRSARPSTTRPGCSAPRRAGWGRWGWSGLFRLLVDPAPAVLTLLRRALVPGRAMPGTTCVGPPPAASSPHRRYRPRRRRVRRTASAPA